MLEQMDKRKRKLSLGKIIAEALLGGVLEAFSPVLNNHTSRSPTSSEAIFW